MRKGTRNSNSCTHLPSEQSELRGRGSVYDRPCGSTYNVKDLCFQAWKNQDINNASFIKTLFIGYVEVCI